MGRGGNGEAVGPEGRPSRRDDAEPARPDGRPSRLRRAAGALAYLTAAVLLATGATAAWIAVTMPDVAALARERPDTTAFMRRYLERRETDGGLPPLRHRWAPASDVSLHVFRAVVSAEDMEFYFHDGFSASEMRAALREALSGGRIRGASTITQQLAKNLWLSPSRNPLRKVREAVLTRALERHLSKARILEIYVNVVELGPGIYGVDAASRHYFGVPASQLSERQAAMLAASLPRPSTWHPGVESRAYASYVDDVLGRMGRADFLWSYARGTVPGGVTEPEPITPELPVLDSLLGSLPDTVRAPALDTSLVPVPDTSGAPAADTSGLQRPPGR